MVQYPRALKYNLQDTLENSVAHEKLQSNAVRSLEGFAVAMGFL